MSLRKDHEGCSPFSLEYTPRLNELIRRNHYEPDRPIWEEENWLTWGFDSSKENGIPFDEYFCDSAKDDRLFISNHHMVGDAYDEAVARFRQQLEAGTALEPTLVSIRDELRKQSTPPDASKLKAVFKVWVTEAERAVLDDRGAFAGSLRRALRKDDMSGLGLLLRETRRMWWRLTGGRNPDFERPMSLFTLFSTSPALDTTTKNGLLYHSRPLQEQVEKLQPIIAKRKAYDKLLNALLNDQPIPGWDELGGGSSQHRPVQADHYAKQVAPYIDEAENLTHAYALALAVRGDTIDQSAVREYRKKESKNERDRIRGAWRNWGYLNLGPHTNEKLPDLKQRVKKYANEGVFPTPPESS